MLRLDIDTKRREPTIVRGANVIFADDAGSLDKLLTDLLWRLHSWVQRIDDSDEGFLRYAVGVRAQGGGDLLVNGRLVGLRSELDKEVASVYGEEGGEEVRVGDFVGVDGVAVAAWTCVDANVCAVGCGEAVEDSYGGTGG